MGAALKLNRRERVTLAIDAGSEPPTEFKIFSKGLNQTTKGDFVFDESSAKSVMTEYQAHGIDLMIDYDHASLAPLVVDPALASKAAGWFAPEVRNGELWATNVRWCEPAAEALRRKEWRFMSPAFEVDVETNRVTSLLNVAITNLPATRRLTPLVAANLKTLGGCMNPEDVKAALAAIESGDADKALEILKNMIATAVGGEAPAEETPAEPVEMADVPTDPEEDDKKDEVAAAVAASARLVRLTGKGSFVEAIDEVEVWRAKALRSDKIVEEVAKERAAIELGRRKENAITLTKLGAETPHTTGLAKGKLVKRLLEEPLDEQNDRVKQLLAARGGKLPADTKVEPPNGEPTVSADGGMVVPLDGGGQYELSARVVKMLSDGKVDIKAYATRMASLKKKAG